MTAADQFRKLEHSRAWKELVTPRNIVLAVLCLAVPIACEIHGRRAERAKHAESPTQVLIAKSAELHDTSAARMVHAIEVTDDAKHARAQHAKTLTRLKIAGDEVMLDGAPLAAPVARVITTAEIALEADSVAGAAKDSVIASQDREIALVTDRAELAEKKKAPRFGIKTGIALGATGLGALLFGAAKLIRVFK